MNKNTTKNISYFLFVHHPIFPKMNKNSRWNSVQQEYFVDVNINYKGLGINPGLQIIQVLYFSFSFQIKRLIASPSLVTTSLLKITSWGWRGEILKNMFLWYIHYLYYFKIILMVSLVMTGMLTCQLKQVCELHILALAQSICHH